MTDNKKNIEDINPKKNDGTDKQQESDIEKGKKSSEDKTSISKPKTDKQQKPEKKVTSKKRATKQVKTTARRTAKTTKSKSKSGIKKEDPNTKREKPVTIKSDKTDVTLNKDKKTKLVDKVKDSNYQINLIDENSLKIKVKTERAININCSVRDKKGKSGDSKTQSNKILIHPKPDLKQQEVEITISVDPDSAKRKPYESVKIDTTNQQVSSKSKLKDSNYQISLTDENFLKINVSTEKAISVDCSVKDRLSKDGDADETQSNKILVHPKSNLQQQEVEITVLIDPESWKLQPKVSEKIGTTEKEIQGPVLIPNPEVAELIGKKEFAYKEAEGPPLTPDEILQEKLGRKNPYKIFRKVYQRNLLRGIVGALIIYFISVFTFYGIASKESSKFSADDQRRLIVIQDLPEPKIKLKNVEDPMKPEEEVTSESNVQLRKLPPPKRNFKRNTKITRPYKNPTKDTSGITNTNEELDSLRKLNAGNLDSLNADSLLTNFVIPDSLRKDFSEDDIGLRMYFPNNWKLTDQRDINKNEKDFKGVLLTDTTAKQEGTMTLFIFLDREGKDFRKDDFKTEFKMEDTTLTAYSKEPRNIAGFTEYKFYIFGKTEKLSVGAQIRKQYFEEYKNVIEAVVRSIKIDKANTL